LPRTPPWSDTDPAGRERVLVLDDERLDSRQGTNGSG
jgi:hypothetical protein